MEPKENAGNHQTVKVPKRLRAAIQVKKDWSLTWWEQFNVLLKRTFKERCRDYFDYLRIIQATVVAILLGLLWWKSNTTTEAHLRDQVRVTPSFSLYVLARLLCLSTDELTILTAISDRFNVLHLHLLDIDINIWGSLRLPIREVVFGKRTKGRYVQIKRILCM